jgi:nucleoside 2-deoxyribosyltransferase
MRVVYVAGPYRGADAWEIERNIRRAETVALELWRMGAAPVCPHTSGRFFDGALPDDTFLRGDLALLERCDGVVLVKGWEGSAGTLAEVKYANKIGKPVFKWPGGNIVRRWLLERWLSGLSVSNASGATMAAGQ